MIARCAAPLCALFGGLLALVLCVGAASQGPSASANASASQLVILSEANRAKLGERSRRTTTTPNPASAPSPSAAPSASQSPNGPLIVKGRVLVLTPQYLTFTTGDSVRLEPSLKVPANLSMGTTVRVNIDAQSHVVTAVQREDNSPEPAEIDAAAIPRDVVAVDPRSARTEAEVGSSNLEAGAAGAVAVTIHVTVPNFTPSDSVIYLSTERTNFSSAELRMNRVSGFDWQITIPLAAGSTLRYDFTRGSPATVERQLNGTIFVPRTLVATAGLRTRDIVTRWADKY